MCQAFSCIVPREGSVIWKMGIDSHDELIEMSKLRDTVASCDAITFARCEVVPKNNNYLTPDGWEFLVDERITPEWWGKGYEQMAMDAKDEWYAELETMLVRKPTVHPFRDVKPPKRITKKHLALLKDWNSVRNSVWDSVGDSVGNSVWASVGASVGNSVWASVWDSVWNSVGNSVWASVGDSVWNSVWDSVWDSVGAYIGSFFCLPRKDWKRTENIKTDGYPFQPAVDLWEIGLVPSFDGELWRLHGGPDGKVLWEGNI